MNKDLYREAVLESTSLRRTDKVLALNICQKTDENGRGCYATISTMSDWIKGVKNTTKSSLARLVEQGFLTSRPAGEDKLIPKRRGYVWDLVEQTEGSMIDPSPKGQSLTPQRVEGSIIDPSTTSQASTKLDLKSQSLREKRQNLRGQSLTPSRSTTTDLLGDDAGSGGGTSRVCEATPCATQPAPEDQVKRLQEEIVTALAGVDAYYADAEQQAAHAVRQNRKHVRLILDKIGNLEDAIDYVQLRGVEWCERVKAGQDYCSPVILSQLAEDAQEGWVKPKNPGPALKKKIEKQIATQLAGKATWKIRAAWLEEHWAGLRAADEAASSRPPVALGAVVRALVPQVDAPIVAPQATVRTGEAQRPAWWAEVLLRFEEREVQREAGIDRAVGLALEMGLQGALVVASGGVVRVTPGAGLSLAWAEALHKHAPTWTVALTRIAQQLGQQVRVVWAAEGDEVATEETAPIELTPPPPPPAPAQMPAPAPSQELALTPEPTPEPRSAITRRPSARPSWWSEALLLLRATSGRWRHQEGDQEGAAALALLAELLKAALRAQVDAGALRIELGAVSPAQIGQLAATRDVWGPELARVVEMSFGPVQQLLIAELDEPGEGGAAMSGGV